MYTKNKTMAILIILFKIIKIGIQDLLKSDQRWNVIISMKNEVHTVLWSERNISKRYRKIRLKIIEILWQVLLKVLWLNFFTYQTSTTYIDYF